jgi:hypothetical protein
MRRVLLAAVLFALSRPAWAATPRAVAEDAQAAALAAHVHALAVAARKLSESFQYGLKWLDRHVSETISIEHTPGGVIFVTPHDRVEVLRAHGATDVSASRQHPVFERNRMVPGLKGIDLTIYSLNRSHEASWGSTPSRPRS